MGDIHAYVPIQREYIKTYVSPGVTRYTVQGYQQDAFTRLATGKTIFVNASGPGTVWVYPDRVVQVLEGHTVYIPYPVLGGLFLFTGQVNVDTTTGTIASNKGHVTNLCPLLT